MTANPTFTVTDKYGNGTTNPYASMVVTATVSNSPATWTLGGSTVQPIVNGSCTFTDLTATVIGTSAVSNAAIHFAISGGPISATNSTSFTIGAPPSQFTQGNLAAIQVDTTAANSTFSVIEIKPSAAGQTKPVNINPITATGTNALRMGGGGAGHLALSDDGTFLVFGAFDDGSSATVDETFNLNRAVGTLDYTNKFTKTGKYVSNSLGGSAVRAACSPDNVDFLIDDKGGLYVYNSGNGQSFNVYEQNNYCVRSFGGSAWSLTQKVVANVPSPAVFQFNNGTVGQLDYYNSGNDGPWNTTSATPPPDGLVVDFYMISTNGTQDPASFAILYTLDQNGGTNGASGVINKWSRNADDSWTAIGSWTNTDNGNTLFATTNGSGGVYLYYANGTGAANSIIRVTDQSLTGFDQHHLDQYHLYRTRWHHRYRHHVCARADRLCGCAHPAAHPHCADMAPRPALRSVSRTPRTTGLAFRHHRHHGERFSVVVGRLRHDSVRAGLSSIRLNPRCCKSAAAKTIVLQRQQAIAPTRSFKPWPPFPNQRWPESR